MNARWRRTALLARHALKHRLDLLLPVERIPGRALRLTCRTLQRLLPEPAEPRGERLYQALMELGPVYIKLGQLMSTRRDLLPADVADALARLQDQVPPIRDFSVHAFVHEQLGADADTLFEHIDAEPLACASIAQVHAARLAAGEEVVLKIVRPGIGEQVRADMAHLKFLAGWVHERIPDARRLHLPRVAADHEAVLLEEMNMFLEARNQIQLRRNFAESDLLYVPRVYGQFTRGRLLVMERVYGVPISQVGELRRRGVDLALLAHKGVETFFTQVFEHNFFHADMHPGNILIDTTDPSNPRYIALDCAIIGVLTRTDQSYLARNLVAFFDRDYATVVRLHLDSGWVPADTDPDAFEQVIRSVCEPIFAKPLSEISFGDFVVQLFRAAGQFNMEIQPQLVLLQKTLLYIEGLGRQLYPQLDLWQTAFPFMQRWVAERSGPLAIIADLLHNAPEGWRRLLQAPGPGEDARTLRTLRIQVESQGRTLARIEHALARRARGRTYRRGAGAALVGAAVIMLWQPLASGIGGGDLSTLAGVLSALLGSAMLVRA